MRYKIKLNEELFKNNYYPLLGLEIRVLRFLSIVIARRRAELNKKIRGKIYLPKII